MSKYKEDSQFSAEEFERLVEELRIARMVASIYKKLLIHHGIMPPDMSKPRWSR